MILLAFPTPPLTPPSARRVAGRYLRATVEVDEAWVAERTRALEEILRIPVDGGDWAGCARRCQEAVDQLEGTLRWLEEKSNHHPYFGVEMDRYRESFKRTATAPQSYRRAAEELDTRAPGSDPVWDWWRAWLAARARAAVRTVADAFGAVPHVFSFQASEALAKAARAARAEGVDVGRPGPELEKWLRAHRAGLSAARKGYMEESVPSPLKLLNGLLNDLRENPRTDESYGALRELNLKGLRLIIFDEERDPRYDTALVGKLLRVHQRLERAGLGAVWYGTVLYVSRKDGTLTGKDLEEARAAGYDLKSYAGVYNASRDQIKLHGYPDEAARTLAHELGHRYWFRFLKREDRLRYQEAVRTAPLKFDSEEARQKYLDDMDYFPGETDEAGQEKPLVPVSSYGATNAHEAFAEAFMYYVMGMGMSAEARAAFRQVVGLR